jgi:hypothetical protein
MLFQIVSSFAPLRELSARCEIASFLAKTCVLAIGVSFLVAYRNFFVP